VVDLVGRMMLEGRKNRDCMLVLHMLRLMRLADGWALFLQQVSVTQWGMWGKDLIAEQTYL
jgi:hypothetical protein